LRVLERLGLLHVPAEEARAALRDGLEAQGLSEKEANAALEKLSSAAKPGTSPLVTFSMEKYRRLVDPSDAKAEVAARARSYLHANCAQCHVEAGGGNAQMELEFTTALAKARVRDVKPVHDSYGLPEARLVAPGHPERSVLLHRMSHRGAGHMPPLATAVVDDEAVALLRTWIEQLKPSK
jgi:mono/diheme cytochrome c family protein